MRKTLLLILVIFSLASSAQISVQEQPNWCWASCIQSVMWQANTAQTQPQIVARLTGYPYDRPANGAEITYILKSYYFKAWEVPYPANHQQLYNILASGWKLIAFVNPSNNPQVGHFILLQRISNNGLIVISDPSSGMTYEQNIEQLYFAWKWGRSVVVGTPF